METSIIFDQPAAKLTEIRGKIGRGEYRVDEHAVADAILRRRLSEDHSRLGFQPLDVPVLSPVVPHLGCP
jgi:hypothetical protein